MSFKNMVSQMQMGMPKEAPPKSASPAPTQGSPSSHLKAAKKAHKAGDHKAAKNHAFAFVKSLGARPPHARPTGPAPAAPMGAPTPAGAPVAAGAGAGI